MLKNTILLLLFSFLGCSIYGQNCLPEGITFSSQQQIDDFADDYSGCSIIEGDVMIFEGSDDITNLNGLLGLTKIEGDLDILLNSNLLTLDGLDNLTEVDGFVKLSYSQNLNSIGGLKNLTAIGDDLRIVNTNISDLTGLEKLETVTGDFEIFNNDALTSLSGIESLTSIGGNFNLEQSSLLADVEGLKELVSIGGNFEISDVGISNFSGLGKLTTIEGELRISSNSALESCIGLNSLSTLNGHLLVLGNPVLTSFEGLGLTSIGGLLTISNNDALLDLNGLENLNTVGNYLNIGYNDELISLNGLNSLNTIGGNLNIVDNSKLTDISALESIDPETISSNTNFTSDIEIHQNDLLSVCENLAICLALDSGKSASIADNAPGCNSKEEIESECASSILPVEWLEPLSVISDKNGHLIRFATAQEVNSEMFIVERSRDGKSFEGVIEIAGQGNSSVETYYSVLDQTPWQGLNYYRVNQIDFDGVFSYSNIVVIENNTESALLNIYPNPASTRLNIESFEDDLAIQIFNYQGVIVRELKLEKGINSITTEDFSKGICFIKSFNRFTKKIWIQ